MFVVVEGIEGSGKTTLLKGLAQHLRSGGLDPAIAREPGGTPVGDAIRSIFLDYSVEIDALAEALLVNAARAQHVAAVLRPAARANRFILCDRFSDSTLAYQGYGRGLDLDALQALCDIATGGFEPDLVFVLDLPVEQARLRMRQRGVRDDRIEAESNAFHERVRQGFLALARRPKRHLLDAGRDAEDVLAEAVNLLDARMKA